MQFLTVVVALFLVCGVKSAALPQLTPRQTICLCLDGEHCFNIDGRIENNFLITQLAENVDIHLSLDDFQVSPPEACVAHVRNARSTDIDVHTSDHGSHVGVDHKSENTHAHGSVDVDKNGHMSGNGGIEHSSGHTNTHGSVDVDKNGHISGGGGFEHSSGNVHTHGSVSVDKDGHVHYEGGASIHIGKK